MSTEVSYVSLFSRVGEVLICTVPRRFRDFNVYPTVVTPKDSITVSGFLEYQPFPIPPWNWVPATGDTVVLYVDGVKYKETNTAADGSFKFVIDAGTLSLGRHVIYCDAPEIPLKGCYVKSSEVTIQVVTEDEYKKIQQESQMFEMIKWLAIGGSAAAVVAIALTLYQREKQFELMRWVLARK